MFVTIVFRIAKNWQPKYSSTYNLPKRGVTIWPKKKEWTNDTHNIMDEYQNNMLSEISQQPKTPYSVISRGNSRTNESNIQWEAPEQWLHMEAETDWERHKLSRVPSVLRPKWGNGYVGVYFDQNTVHLRSIHFTECKCYLLKKMK